MPPRILLKLFLSLYHRRKTKERRCSPPCVVVASDLCVRSAAASFGGAVASLLNNAFHSVTSVSPDHRNRDTWQPLRKRPRSPPWHREAELWDEVSVYDFASLRAGVDL